MSGRVSVAGVAHKKGRAVRGPPCEVGNWMSAGGLSVQQSVSETRPDVGLPWLMELAHADNLDCTAQHSTSMRQRAINLK